MEIITYHSVNSLITSFNGIVWWGEKHYMVCYNNVDITPSNLFSEWCKEMAANPSGVSPLRPHLRLSTDSPLPLGRLTSSATWGRPPYPQLNMLTGRNHRGENHVVKTLYARPLCPASFILRPGNKKYPKSWKMTSINHNVNHYCSEQKSSWEIPWWKLL